MIRGKGRRPGSLIFDHGPVGYLSIAAHGHADTLAVWLSIGTQPVFVDAGTYLYHSSKALRDAFRQPQFTTHLTLLMAFLKPPFRSIQLGHQGECALYSLEDGPIALRVVAEHDGYVLRDSA